ncbi:delta-60 repeat domain-containing protein [Desulfobulbus alkaliphilus]|uniref:delta-60 repeat domain-containing protein n=1 Tax=Desulfobulbus alkaliphilus TaxID=869814 RepID=UPI0019624DDE|nr:delta-60 repeat domain-containing protein [Desulfobulbus alkaliphilus]MBM9536057.1 hypothetical protein [Desulfobulbus alkaliphilus]
MDSGHGQVVDVPILIRGNILSVSCETLLRGVIMWKRSLWFIVVGLLLSCAKGEVAQATTRLDTAFGIDGRVAVEIGAGNSGHAVVVQPDGRIVVAGSTMMGATRHFSLVRFNRDGSLDTTFNGEGAVITPVASGDSEALALGLLADGRLIAAGYADNGMGRDFALVCYFADGSLDLSFGENGMVIDPIGNSHEEITALLIDSKGMINAAGSVAGTTGRVLAVARYYPDGTPDGAFGEGGVSLIGIGVDATAEGLVEGVDGGLIVSGSCEADGLTTLMLVGLTANGTIDSGFGSNGVAVAGGAFSATEGYGMAVDDQGRLYLAGSTGVMGERDAALFRFTSSGEPDLGFGDQGAVITQVSEEDDVLYDVSIGPGGAVASGFTTDGGLRRFLLITYEETGLSPSPSITTFDSETVPAELDEPTPAPARIQEVRVNGNTRMQIRELQVYPFFFGSSAQHGTLDVPIAGSVNGLQRVWSNIGLQFSRFLLSEAFAADGDNGVSGETGTVVSRILTTTFSDGEAVSYAVTTDENGQIIVVGTADGTETSLLVAARYEAPLESTAFSNQPGYTNTAITTRPPTDVSRTSVVTGGEISPAFGSVVTRRGVVFSTAPDPVYSGGTGGTGNNGSNGNDGSNGSDEGSNDQDTNEPEDNGATFAPAHFLDRIGGFLVADAVAAASSTSGTRSIFAGTNDSSPKDDFVKDGETENGSGYGRFGVRVENLQPGTIYYVRAYAQTAAGTVYYGNQESFRTADACFVATASFGTALHPGVVILRDFRDRFLIDHAVGRWMMDQYYAVSPSLAERIAANTSLRSLVRLMLLPWIGLSWLLLQTGPGSVFLILAGVAVLVGRVVFPIRATA